MNSVVSPRRLTRFSFQAATPTDSYRSRSAFTLVELLVVIAIIGVLVALLLPAVQQAREAARRMSCNNNLKQLALALHMYHDTHNVFPSAYLYYAPNQSTRHRWGWQHTLFPMIEQGARYDQIMALDPTHMMDVPAALKDDPIPAFVCPSNTAGAMGGNSGVRPTSDPGLGFKASYVACAGNNNLSQQELNGIFSGHGSRMPARFNNMASILDGTTNTIAFSECVARVTEDTGWGDAGAMWGGNLWGGFGFSTEYGPNTTVADQVYSGQGSMPQFPVVNVGGNWADLRNFARSHHPGGANAAFADGSVHFIPNTIDQNTYQGLGTKAGRETLGNF